MFVCLSLKLHIIIVNWIRLTLTAGYYLWTIHQRLTLPNHIFLLKNVMLSMLTSIVMVAWVLDFLSNRPQYLYFNENSSTVLVTSTSTRQSCVIPVLVTLYTEECRCFIVSLYYILQTTPLS